MSKNQKKKNVREEISDKEMAKLEKEVEAAQKKGLGYGSPPKYIPKLNCNTQLLFGARDWCIVLDNSGKAYAISQDDNKNIKTKAL